MKRAIVVGIVIGLSVVLPRAGWAEQRRPGVVELLQAIELIRRDRCDAAVPLLRRSNELGGFMNSLWNLAECYVVLNRPELAIEAYQDYIDHPRTDGREEEQARRAISGLEGLLARIEVRGNVEGAAVLVDGQELGVVPAVVRVGPGDHIVAVASPGFATWSQQITTGSGEERSLEAALRPLPGEVSVDGRPVGAEVWIDGELRGESPWRGELEGGGHVVELRAEGRRPLQRQVMVLPGQRSNVEVELARLEGVLAVAVAAPQSRLLVDGEDRGGSPFGPLTLSPGRHQVEVSAPDHIRWRDAVDILDGRTSRVEVDLATTEGLHPGWFWSALGLTVSSAAAGVVLVLLGRESLREFEADARFISESETMLLETANHREAGREALDMAQTLDTAGWALLGLAATGLISSLVVGLQTRFTQGISRASISLAEEIPETDDELPPQRAATGGAP